METKPSFEDLEQLVKELREESIKRRRAEKVLTVVFDALDSSVSGVIITGKKGKIRYANPSFLSMFEYKTKREVIGKYATELFVDQEIRRFADVKTIIAKSKGLGLDYL